MIDEQEKPPPPKPPPPERLPPPEGSPDTIKLPGAPQPPIVPEEEPAEE